MKKESKPILIISSQEIPSSTQGKKTLTMNAYIPTLVGICRKVWVEEPDILFLEEVEDMSRIEFFERHLGHYFNRFNLKTKIVYVLSKDNKLGKIDDKRFEIHDADTPSWELRKLYAQLNNSN